jgi:3-oxoadipate enol-lactonase
MIFKTNDNLDLYYEIRGDVNATNKIIFLNGLTQTTMAWEFVINTMVKNCHIVLVDSIFQGKSSAAKKHRTFDEHATDIFGLCQFVFGGPAIVVGISYGSLIAQHLAVKYPLQIKKLVLISTFAHKTPLYKSIELSWKNALIFGGYELLLDVMLPYVLGKNYFDNPFIPIDTLKNLRKDLQPESENILKLMQATEERPDYLNELKQLDIPTLIIQGQNDLLFPEYYAEAVHEAIKNSTLKIFPNCGHTINLEAPMELAKVIQEFI